MKEQLWQLDMFDGMLKIQPLTRALERESAHRVLCQVFSLDPATYWFDLPSTAYGTGSASGDARRGRRVVNGYVHRGPRGSDPVGVLTRVDEPGHVPDVDPHDPRDFFNLNNGR